mmetsp:Transcript_11206/g.16551  ORF Transcript_11206/g.16551 Transcript_11206/m.16551 type:complete len:572 (+) Transcript_11206:3-1718(+)
MCTFPSLRKKKKKKKEKKKKRMLDQINKNLKKMISIANEKYNLELTEHIIMKPLVMIIGNQSAAKSSFLNHIYGNLKIRKTGSQAIDTHFTLIETVSEEQFEKLKTTTKKKEKREIADYERAFNEQNIMENIAYLELTTTEKYERYQQYFQGPLSRLFTAKEMNMLRAIIVNEKYVKPTQTNPEKAILTKNVLFLDTPGFNDYSKENIPHIDIMHFFFKQCAKCLVMLDCMQLSSIQSTISLLRLLMVWDNKETILKQMKKKQTNSITEAAMGDPTQNNNSFLLKASTIGINMIMTQTTGPLWQVIKPFATNHIQAYMNTQPKKESLKKEEEGDTLYSKSSNLYDIVNLVITKIDQCDDIPAAYLELGLSIGDKLPRPVSDHIHTMGIPWEQQKRRVIYQGRNYTDLMKDIKEQPYLADTLLENVYNQMLRVPRESIRIGDLKRVERLIDNFQHHETQIACSRAYVEYVFSEIQRCRESRTAFDNVFSSVTHFISKPFSQIEKLYRQSMGLANMEFEEEEDESIIYPTPTPLKKSIRERPVASRPTWYNPFTSRTTFDEVGDSWDLEDDHD